MRVTSFQWLVAFLCISVPNVIAKTHKFDYTVKWKNVTIGNSNQIKQVISFNDQWPLPTIHVNKGDRVELYLTNGLEKGQVTSLHFHGLFQNTSDGNQLQMDGPSMITQCPIIPGDTYFYNFTVADQVGTYWYHAHQGAQYGDGFRGAFIIHDPEEPFEYDEEYVLPISDLYFGNYKSLEHDFLNRYNPTGAELIPDTLLFNDSMGGSIDFTPGKTYLLRFVNTGLFVSQYITMEDHDFTIVEVDGVYVKPNITNLIYISAGQRMAVLVKAKEQKPSKNYALMQIMDQTMLDMIPSQLRLNMTNEVSYDKEYSYPESLLNHIDQYPWLSDLHSSATEEFYLEPLKKIPIYDKYDRQIVFDVRMDNLGDGVNYAFFNNITYVSPKVPVLTTLLTSGKLATDPRVYGENINVNILNPGEIVEIVINNYDTGRHPFHFHGHIFQIVQKSPPFNEDVVVPPEDQDSLTVPYDESNPVMDYPDFPMMRDTVLLEPNGHVVLRFKADNPGVWFFHCHVDWHLQQGLAAVFVEDPLTLQSRESLSDNYKQICSSQGIPNEGNAAGHADDWFNMDGLPRQPKPLPEGFTIKGYLAFFISTLVGLWGMFAIGQYGFSEFIPEDAVVYDKLKQLLEDNDIAYT